MPSPVARTVRSSSLLSPRPVDSASSAPAPSPLPVFTTRGFVATFTGANVLRGTARTNGADLTRIEFETGETLYSTDHAEGPVDIVVYPWEISIGHRDEPDSAMNVIQDSIRSVVYVGNRARIRIGPITAEVTEASIHRLGLTPGTTAVASFKATGNASSPTPEATASRSARGQPSEGIVRSRRSTSSTRCSSHFDLEAIERRHVRLDV